MLGLVHTNDNSSTALMLCLEPTGDTSTTH